MPVAVKRSGASESIYAASLSGAALLELKFTVWVEGDGMNRLPVAGLAAR